jgi:hypothetical protein
MPEAMTREQAIGAIEDAAEALEMYDRHRLARGVHGALAVLTAPPTHWDGSTLVVNPAPTHNGLICLEPDRLARLLAKEAHWDATHGEPKEGLAELVERLKELLPKPDATIRPVALGTDPAAKLHRGIVRLETWLAAQGCDHGPEVNWLLGLVGTLAPMPMRFAEPKSAAADPSPPEVNANGTVHQDRGGPPAVASDGVAGGDGSSVRRDLDFPVTSSPADMAQVECDDIAQAEAPWEVVGPTAYGSWYVNPRGIGCHDEGKPRTGFFGPNAEPRAREYAAWLNTGETPDAPTVAPATLRAIHAAAHSLALQLAGVCGSAESLRDRTADAVMGADFDGSVVATGEVGR